MARLLLRFTVLFTVACFTLRSASAQTAPVFRFEFTEKPGLYSVGFKVVEQYDRSRSFQAPPALPGNSVATDGPRPLQTLLWYPAEMSSHATMTFWGLRSLDQD